MSRRTGVKLLAWFLTRFIDAAAGAVVALFILPTGIEGADLFSANNFGMAFALVVVWMQLGGFAVLTLYFALVGRSRPPLDHALLNAGLFVISTAILPFGLMLLNGSLWWPDSWRIGLILVFGPPIVFASTLSVRTAFARSLN